MLHIKLGDELKSILAEKAKKLGLPLNAYIRMILIESIGKN